MKNPMALDMTVKQITDEAMRCRAMFFDGGGVTFTGGEATCQFDSLKAVLTFLKQENINTAIETNGTHPLLPELFPLLDELIMDFKHYDTQKHEAIIGAPNRIIKENLIKALASHPNLLVRIPLIGHFNASVEDMEQFISFFTAYAHKNVRFELLPYHEYGKEKWLKCGKEYTVQDAFVTEEARAIYETLLTQHGLNVIRT
jgi:pyruvate formate lyase activating enzyme